MSYELKDGSAIFQPQFQSRLVENRKPFGTRATFFSAKRKINLSQTKIIRLRLIFTSLHDGG